jgi:hypothetical protein
MLLPLFKISEKGGDVQMHLRDHAVVMGTVRFITTVDWKMFIRIHVHL